MLRIIWKIRMLLLSENELFYINGSETLPPPLSLHRLTTFASIILCARIGADVYRKIQYNFIHPPVECQRIYH